MDCVNVSLLIIFLAGVWPRVYPAEAPLVECGTGRGCPVVLLSLNPATLVCPGAFQHAWINWTFQGLTDTGYSSPPLVIQTSRAPSSLFKTAINLQSGAEHPSVLRNKTLSVTADRRWLGHGPNRAMPVGDRRNVRRALGLKSNMQYGETARLLPGWVQVFQSSPVPSQARPLRLLPPSFRLRNYLTSRPMILPSGPQASSSAQPPPQKPHTSTAPPGQSQMDELQSRLRGGEQNLIFAETQLQDSGLYTCRAGDVILARFQVEVQDVGRVQLSHASIGPPPKENRTVRLEKEQWEEEVEVFTLWGAWQGCNCCGAVGERKRIGLCYARLQNVSSGEETHTEALPCGMVESGLGRRLQGGSIVRGPEVVMETCWQDCPHPRQYADDIPTLLRMLYLSLLKPVDITTSSDTVLLCPSASIYSPLYWERDAQPLTQLDLLLKNSTHSLDFAHGGNGYLIQRASPSDSGVYRCFQEGRLKGGFLLRVEEQKRARQSETKSRDMPASELVALSLFSFSAFVVVLWLVTMARQEGEGSDGRLEIESRNTMSSHSLAVSSFP